MSIAIAGALIVLGSLVYICISATAEMNERFPEFDEEQYELEEHLLREEDNDRY